MRVSFKEFRIERFWQKFAHLDGFCLVIKVREDHRNVAAEFPDDLPASAAWRGQLFGVDHHGDAAELLRTFGNALPDRDTLGTHRQSVARGFHITARIDSAVVSFNGRSYLEI